MHADAEDDQCSVLLYYSENDPTKWQNRELGKNELLKKKIRPPQQVQNHTKTLTLRPKAYNKLE